MLVADTGRHEDKESSGPVRHPGPAGPSAKTALRCRWGPRTNMTASELSSAVTTRLCGSTAATRMTGLLRLARIAAAAGVIKANSFTIDGEAVVLGA